MLDRLWSFLGRNLPDELSACMDCGVDECLGSKWRKCPTRLERVAALKAAREKAAAEFDAAP